MSEWRTTDEKTERNARVQTRYGELSAEGKHGFYETMFRIVHEEVDRERERCALLCGDLAYIMENGAGDPEPGGRLRQAARNIRDPEHQPMNLEDYK